MNTSTNVPVKKGKRSRYWEPIFEADFPGVTDQFDWNKSRTTEVENCVCRADALNDSGKSYFKDINFLKCDFRGDFNLTKLTFTACSFEYCDLGSSTWRNVKFQKCKFKSSSITMATFVKCQLVDCEWSDIGFSGNETRIDDCLITNPKEFIASAYTNIDPDILKDNGTTPHYQKMRLESTKTTVARAVLISLERNGSDRSYYEAVKTYLNQSIDASIAEASYNSIKNKSKISLLKKGFLYFEKTILNTSGMLNGWGG